jgi:pimeloyl-ACP methyl ester carboxylesterase
MIDISIAIGNLTNFGFFGFDARNMDYDPRDTLLNVESPGLYVFADNDVLVTPALNIERLEEIFNGNIPAHLSTVVIDNATHGFRIVNDPCEVLDKQPISEELVEVLNNWLTEQGY